MRHLLELGLKAEVDALGLVQLRQLLVAIALMATVTVAFHKHLIFAGLVFTGGLLLTDLDILHDLPFDGPSDRVLLHADVLLELLDLAEKAFFSGLSLLLSQSFLLDLPNKRLAFLLQMLDSLFEPNYVIFELLYILTPLNSFLYLDFEMFRWSGEELVVFEYLLC